MVRLFAAIPIPQDIGQALVKRQTALEGARWRTAESLHITLKFFGDVREDIARDLDSELARVGGRPFEIQLEGAGSFGDGLDIHAIWAGVAENAELRRLAKACETAGRRAGLKADARHYRPHVTLAYLRHADPLKVANWIQGNNLLKSPAILVERFALYSSTLGKEGSHYTLEADYLLR